MKTRSPIIRRHVRGVTLLEVLIAIFIISIGLLGTAGLQANGLKASVGASQRSAATLLASGMADRMRANMVGVTAGYYTNYTAAQQATCLTTGCTPQQMALHDAWEWNQSIADNLPSGQGIVCKDTSPDDGASNTSVITAACDGIGNTYAIKIWWLEDRSEANPAGTLKRVVIAFQP